MSEKLKLTKSQFLSLVVFTNGAVIMSVEMIGAKTIAPYFGSSVYVWTAVIGVILASLALGYWHGGVIADKSANLLGLSKIFIISAVILAFTVLLQTPVLNFIADNIPSLRLQSSLASLVLFAPSIYFMGMVSPYVAKLALTKLKETGETIGKLYALGTFGSIAGTFLTGYYLINYIGIRQLYWIFIGCLVGLSLICLLASGQKLKTKNLVLFLILTPLFLALSTQSLSPRVVAQKDTAYSTYKVIDGYHKGKPTRLLVTDDGGAQSGILINDPYEPAFDYVESVLDIVQKNKPKNLLLIGGGSYTIPTILGEKSKDIKIDIVEIDPELDEIAKKYFLYEESDNKKIFHEDGRTFLNNTKSTYDMIIVDAYNSLRPPSHLITVEAMELMKKALKPNGLLVSNVIGSIDGERSEFAASIYATMGENFENIGVYPASKRTDKEIQNLIFVAGNSNEVMPKAVNEKNQVKIKVTGLIFTDDFAPVERLLGDF